MASQLRKWRKERGWDLADVSGLSGRSISYLSRVERGLYDPPPATKVQIARAVGAKVAEIFPREAT
jgi:transcriptional regulator with XRE-family HTH domain